MGIVRIEIDDSNAAFEDAPATEIGRILRELAESFEQDGGPDIQFTSQPLRDVNGNSVGFVTYDFDAHILR